MTVGSLDGVPEEDRDRALASVMVMPRDQLEKHMLAFLAWRRDRGEFLIPDWIRPGGGVERPLGPH